MKSWNADQFEELLNHESGLFALSNGESDVKALDDRVDKNDGRARFALDVFAVAIRKTIGAYAVLLGGVDLLVFTGGIGEHSEFIRTEGAAGLEFLGLTPDKIQIVSAQEELQIGAPLPAATAGCRALRFRSANQVDHKKYERQY